LHGCPSCKPIPPYLVDPHNSSSQHSFFFFGGLAIPVSQAILAHLFSINMTWSATVKVRSPGVRFLVQRLTFRQEVERSNFFKEVPKILKRFWFPFLVSLTLIAGMIILATPLIPLEWQIDTSSWAVIFPLACVAFLRP
jgi:hypothetical protein